MPSLHVPTIPEDEEVNPADIPIPTIFEDDDPIDEDEALVRQLCGQDAPRHSGQMYREMSEPEPRPAYPRTKVVDPCLVLRPTFP